MEWQPIETAPYGELLTWLPDEGVCVLWHADPAFGGVHEWHDGSGDSYQDYQPTHWMPLPEPPK